MTRWLTAQEIAAARLPGLPESRRGVAMLAERAGWAAAATAAGEALARPRTSQGGGIEFHVSLLPQSARVSLDAARAKAPAAAAPNPPPPVQPPGFTPKDLLRRDARLALLALADAYFAHHPRGGRRAADHGFIAAYNARSLAVAQWITEAIPHASRGSLARWRQVRAAGRWHDLAGGYGGRRGSGVLEMAEGGDVASYISGLIVKQPFLAASHLRDLVEARFGLELKTPSGPKPLPSARAIQRFVAEWKEANAAVLMKLTDPDRFKSHRRFAGTGAYAWVKHLNQLWEIDASPADVLTTDGRFAIYAAVDVWSRRMMVLVTRTARTEATLLLVRRAILAWGVPETIRTDNGSDFTSHAFARALNALGIGHDVTDPFSPEQKGIVERHIGTLQRGLMPLLPGFVGHSVADRKMIEARRSFAARLGTSDEHAFCVDLSAKELQEKADRWCADVYAHAGHDGLKGQSPFVRAQSFTGAIRKIENPRALDLLLAPVAGGDGHRQVTKQGIRLDHGYYISGALMAGARVFCRQDPEDMGRLHVFESETGAWLAEAVCPERAGVDPRAAVAAAREEQQAFIKRETAAVRREAAKIKPRDMIDAVLDLAGRKSAAITAFPRRAEVHDTPSLSAAGHALRTAGAEAPAEGVSTAPPQAASNVVTLPETPEQRFARALALEGRLARGEDADPQELLWLGSYRASSEYRGRKAVHEDFGVSRASV